MHSTLQLRDLADPADLSSLEVKPDFFRGEWLVGFGWDQHRFPNQRYPHRTQLDRFFPRFPVAFSRADGHAMWLNTKALEICGLLRPVREWNLPPGGEAHSDENGMPTGILIDRAMELVWEKIPPDTYKQKISFLKAAQRVFNREGFTHLRDMSGDEEQWQALCELEAQGELSLYVDQNFSFEKPDDFQKALDLSVQASKEKHKHLRSRGVKFYLDGALGSEGAALSQPYGGTQSDGFFLWTAEQIREWMQKAWEKKVEVSIHTIGDRACHTVAVEAKRLWDRGFRGFLNFEHAEVMRSETMDLLRGQPVRLHIQPCHWLSDSRWLEKKLGGLIVSAFPWKAAFDRDLAMSWGSDSPIEAPRLADNQKALETSVSQIPPYPQLWWKPHEHPDPQWGHDCRTVYEEGRVREVVFDGHPLIQNL
jgi:hypothetical protein